MNEMKISVVAGEPRIRDTDLSGVLGFARASGVRKLVKRHRECLEIVGAIAAAPTVPLNPLRPGRPGTDFWLSRQQALLVCHLSEMEQWRTARKVVESWFQEVP